MKHKFILLFIMFFILNPSFAFCEIFFSEDFSGVNPDYSFDHTFKNRSASYPNWDTGSGWFVEQLATGGWDGTPGAHLIIKQGTDQFDPGWAFSVPKPKPWVIGDVAYFRFRIRFDDDMRWDGTGAQSNKMIDWGANDSRIIIFNRKPHDTVSCGLSTTEYQDGTIGGINVGAGITTECVQPVPVTYGQWYHVQVAAKTSDTGDGYLKLWVNNNDVNNPDQERTGMDIGIEQWNDSWDLGGFWTDENNHRDCGWVFDDIEIADSFGANWWNPDEPQSPIPDESQSTISAPILNPIK